MEEQTVQQSAATDQSQAPNPPVEQDEKVFATIGYFWFLFIVPLIAKPKSEFCRFHAKQGIVLFLIWIVDLILTLALGNLVGGFVGTLFSVALVAVYILAVYHVWKGEYWNIPVVSDLAKKIDLDIFFKHAGASGGTPPVMDSAEAEAEAHAVEPTVVEEVAPEATAEPAVEAKAEEPVAPPAETSEEPKATPPAA